MGLLLNKRRFGAQPDLERAGAPAIAGWRLSEYFFLFQVLGRPRAEPPPWGTHTPASIGVSEGDAGASGHKYPAHPLGSRGQPVGSSPGSPAGYCLRCPQPQRLLSLCLQLGPKGLGRNTLDLGHGAACTETTMLRTVTVYGANPLLWALH